MGTNVKGHKSDQQPHDPASWVDLHGDSLYKFALLRLRDRELAEDIVQETFLAALQARHKFAGQSSERTWLIGILKHKIGDYFRRISRETSFDQAEQLPCELEGPFMTGGEWVDHWKQEMGPIEWETNPATTFEKKEFWMILNRGLSSLPARLAQVFVLREMDGLSTEEICQMLDISTSNLWVMLHRARMQLRRFLEINYFGQTMEPSERQAALLSAH